MLKVKLKINKSDQRKINKMPKRFKVGFIKGMRDSMYLVESTTKRRFGKPGELHARTGHLRRSIRTGVTQKPASVVGWIGTSVIYAAIHEFGGTIKPIHSKYLKFQIDGHWVSKKKVKIPKRPYLMPSIEENLERIKDILRQSIIKEVE